MMWEEKWIGIINTVGRHLERSGMIVVVINVDTRCDAKEQYDMYMSTVEQMKERREVVVTTGLPGKERIFWPYEDVQFYVREGDPKVQYTGNQNAFNLLLND